MSVGMGSKNGHPKYTCLKEIGLYGQSGLTILTSILSQTLLWRVTCCDFSGFLYEFAVYSNRFLLNDPQSVISETQPVTSSCIGVRGGFWAI